MKLLERAVESWMTREVARILSGASDDVSRSELRAALDAQRQLIRSKMSRAPTLGARLVLCLVVVDLAAFRWLTANGTPRDRAVERVATVNQQLLAPWLPVMRWSSLLLGGSPIARMRRSFWLVNHLFPFAPPGWKHEHLPSGEGVGLDYTHCPVAEFCLQQEAADLGAAAICALDHEFARALGVRLAREQTLLTGGRLCTFRWERSEKGA